MLPMHTILVPTDFSRRSEYAFQLACALARDYGAKVILLHVHPPPVIMGEFGALPDYLAPESIREQLQPFHPEAGVAVERMVSVGDAATEIVRLAADRCADLIVMGTHGRTGLTRLLVGSVAEAVLRKAGCPVLTVKAIGAEPEPAKTAEEKGIATAAR